MMEFLVLLGFGFLAAGAFGLAVCWIVYQASSPDRRA